MYTRSVRCIYEVLDKHLALIFNQYTRLCHVAVLISNWIKSSFYCLVKCHEGMNILIVFQSQVHITCRVDSSFMYLDLGYDPTDCWLSGIAA